MERLFLKYKVALTLICVFSSLVNAQSSSITIYANEHGALISPLQYGIFYEEAERAVDGGLYAEMIENRSFEGFRNGVEFENRVDEGIMPVMDDPKNIKAWILIGNGKMSLDQSKPLNENNPTSLRVESYSNVSIINAGFLPANQKEGLGVGLACKKNEALELSLYARGSEDFDGELTAILESKNGSILVKKTIEGITAGWKKFKVEFLPNATDINSRLVLKVNSKGTFWLDMVSLFPKDTYKNRPNGLRKDIVEMLADLKPSFVRFPGGCYIEGLYQLKEAWNPMQTLGDVAERPGLPGARWQYGSTDGFGYHEMLQMCEDFGAEPLLVINIAMSHGEEAIIRYDDPGGKFSLFLNRAMDAIEYANGDTNTKWGSKRAANGHPKPFNLEYVEIGNEDNLFPSYEERYAIFGKAIQDKYPKMHIIANSNENQQGIIKGIPQKYPVEIVDEHYYPSVDWCIENFHKYDFYKRNGHKIYVAEFGVVQDSFYNSSSSANNLKAALGEAVFFLGAERNSDVVKMASYCILLCRLDQRMFEDNLIYFDQSRIFGTPAYYVFKLLSNNRGDINLNVKTISPSLLINGHNFSESIYAGATLDKKRGELILKVVNFLSNPEKTTIILNGIEKIKSDANVVSLANKDITAKNSFENPINVSPKIKEISNVSKEFTYEFPANSLTLIRISISDH